MFRLRLCLTLTILGRLRYFSVAISKCDDNLFRTSLGSVPCRLSRFGERDKMLRGEIAVIIELHLVTVVGSRLRFLSGDCSQSLRENISISVSVETQSRCKLASSRGQSHQPSVNHLLIRRLYRFANLYAIAKSQNSRSTTHSYNNSLRWRIYVASEDLTAVLIHGSRIKAGGIRRPSNKHVTTNYSGVLTTISMTNRGLRRAKSAMTPE